MSQPRPEPPENHGLSAASPKLTGKIPAQVILGWGRQQGTSVIPRSTKPSRIEENIDLFDFELSRGDGGDRRLGYRLARRSGSDAITLEAFGREILVSAVRDRLSPSADQHR